MTIDVPFYPLPVDQSDVNYLHGSDSEAHADVPSGDIREFEITGSRVYPGTTRRVWVHTAANHDSAVPAAVMIFNDGWWYLDPDSSVRAGIVLDNLAHAGALPPMIGVFIDPGVFPDRETPKNRNAEYDTFDSRYADFIVEEVLPRVAGIHAISPHPEERGICGGSSGGNGAFTAAWIRPDSFRRVLAFNSSFAQMPDGNPYPDLIRSASPKPLRILLHAAHRDIRWNELEMNWFAENLEVAAALARASYDLRFVLGDGGHSPNHGGVLLPDALRWLWGDR